MKKINVQDSFFDIPYMPIIPAVSGVKISNPMIEFNNNISFETNCVNINGLYINKISDVGQYSIENYLRNIFRNNSNVLFKKIVYSPAKKELYIYSDSNIIIIDKENYKELNTESDISNEINDIFSQEKNERNDVISLYDVITILNSSRQGLNEIGKRFDNIIRREYHHSNTYVKPDVDSENVEFKIIFRKNYESNYSLDEEISFIIENGDLIVKEYRGNNSKKVYSLLEAELEKIKTELLNLKGLVRFFDIFRPINSNFIITIFNFSHGLDLIVNDSLEKGIFRMQMEQSMLDDNCSYKYECKSESIISDIMGKEEEIFKNIYLKIDDFPEHIRKVLFEFRKTQLESEQDTLISELLEEGQPPKKKSLINKILRR